MRLPFNEHTLTFLLLCLSYGFFALFRKCVSTSLPWLSQELDLTKHDMGLISSAFATGYGLSKILGSVTCDYFQPKWILGFGLSVAAVTAIVFAAFPTPTVMISCWTLQGIAQGIAWPTISYIICSNFSPAHRGTIWSTVSSAAGIAFSVGPMIFVSIISKYNWKAPFTAVGACGLIMAVLVWVCVPPPPGPGDTHTTKPECSLDECAVAQPTAKWYLDRRLISFNICNALTFFLLGGTVDWAGLYFIEHCGYSKQVATFIMTCGEVGGFVSTLLCGVVSDKLLPGRLDLSCLIFSIISLPPLLVLLYHSMAAESVSPDVDAVSTSFGGLWGLLKLSYSELQACICLFFIGAGISGPKTLIGMAIREIVPASSAGLAGGVLGLCGQLGLTVAASGLAMALHAYQWQYYMHYLLAASTLLCGVCVTAVMLHVETKKVKVY